MLDFTSSLYLGMRHPSTELGGWRRLTTGRPAVIGPAPEARGLERHLAAVVGTDGALMATSALHGLVDVLDVLAAEPSVVAVDDGAYALSQVAVDRLGGRNVPVARIHHFDPRALAHVGRQHRGRRLVAVVDGFCPGCTRFAPVRALLDVVRVSGGTVVLDDTQAVGLAGNDPGPGDPYGRGGGGTLSRLGLRQAPDVVVVASLAKALGAPVAAIAGPSAVVRRLELEGTTRIHSSPPSTAALRAAASALRLNELDGDTRRRRLARRVQQLRDALRSSGVLSVGGGSFPIQAVGRLNDTTAAALVRDLAARGVAAVAVRPRCRRAAAVVLIVRSDHAPADVRAAAAAVADALAGAPAWPNAAGGAAR